MANNKDKKLSASLEDYLEAIFNLTRKSAIARSKDIARELGVTRPSVTGALRQLARKCLINYQPYGLVSLTKAGQTKAMMVVRKHEIIRSFFADVLGVDRATAQQAACKVEHSLGLPIVDRLMRLTKLTKSPNQGKFINEFKRYCRRE
jgi:DtxR family Mn-dependent transcriptional regulator